MAKQPKDPESRPETEFNSCDKGLFVIHKDFLQQMTEGIKNVVPATVAGKKGFLKFPVAANPKVGLMKPSLKIKHGPGKKESFTFTLDLFIPPEKK
jgi:hypothetical protein